MTTSGVERQFEDFCEKLLKAKSYMIDEREAKIQGSSYRPDFIVTSPEKEKRLVEVKAYASQRIPLAILSQTIHQLISLSKRFDANKNIIITTAKFDKPARESLRGTVTELWDYDFIVDVLKEHHELAKEFEEIVSNLQPFRKSPPTETYSLEYKIDNETNDGFKGKRLSDKLKLLDPGKLDARSFENISVEVLKYLFEPYLTNYKPQKSTETKMHRFDLVAKIKGNENDFWNMLINNFKTRYVVFEFKNYSEKIGQDEIYSTEKYLYPNAMRSTAIVLARNGHNDSAKKASYGALREMGKVIIIISLDELYQMLENKDNGGDPSDVLAHKLDEMMMEIER